MQMYDALTTVIDPVAAGVRRTADEHSLMDFCMLSFEFGVEEHTHSTISLAVSHVLFRSYAACAVLD